MFVNRNLHAVSSRRRRKGTKHRLNTNEKRMKLFFDTKTSLIILVYIFFLKMSTNLFLFYNCTSFKKKKRNVNNLFLENFEKNINFLLDFEKE